MACLTRAEGRRPPPAPAPGTAPTPAADRSPATRLWPARPRVAIETPALSGSINLKGGRIDDVALKNYHETIDPKSPEIVLFSPAGTETPYYAEFGWVGSEAGKLPNSDTVWTADGKTLAPNMPVTLTWTTQRPRLQADHRRRRQVHVHGPRFGREQGRQCGHALSLQPRFALG